VEPGRLGSYEILCPLARGGMAELFLARVTGPQGFEKLFVIKKILPKLARSKQFVELFMNEARIAAALDHPHIAHVYELGRVDGSYYLTMEYVHGQNVLTTMRRTGQLQHELPIDHAVHIGRCIAAALHYAHERRRSNGELLQIIHRDVSPANILIAYDGAVKLVDFGVAKARSSSSGHTKTGLVKGKISYMSPEQAKGEPIDRRSDVFALGIVLWEMVTMQRLYKRENDLAALQAVIHDRAGPPSRLRPSCPPELDRIIMRALEYDPAKRYQNAEQLEIDLEELAREQRLRQSTIQLRALMQELFEPEIAAWREAQESGLTLTDHVMAQTTITRAAPEAETERDDEEYEFEDAEDDNVATQQIDADTIDSGSDDWEPPTLLTPTLGTTAPLPTVAPPPLPLPAPPQQPPPSPFPLAPMEWRPGPPTIEQVPDLIDARRRMMIAGAVALGILVLLLLVAIAR
jgi:serine/threonine protein kinase